MSNSNSMVAHIWAQQEKHSGKSANGNLSFRGETLFSYVTPIGRFVQTVDGERATLVTSNTYSMTTSGKHMPALWRAIDYGRGNFAPCFSVPIVGIYDLTEKDHETNLAHLVAEYEMLCGKYLRARDLYGDETYLIGQLQTRANSARNYASAFGLELPFLDAGNAWREIWRKRAERAARLNAPGMAEKRERERVKRMERKERKEREEREERALKCAAHLEKWILGETNYLPYDCRPIDGSVKLRIRDDKLETSQLASVPLPHAIRVFQFVKLCRERGETWQRNGKTLRVGNFQVDRVDADGSFRAGCHFIQWPEIERVARQHSLFDVEAIDTTEQKELAQ
jgi:hypothetical protein